MTLPQQPVPRRVVGAAATVLIFLAPAVQLLWHGGTGYCFFALLLLALASALRPNGLPGSLAALREHRWFVVGMMAFSVAIPLQWAVQGFFDPRTLDPLSRFALALPIYLLLRQLSSRQLSALGWGCVAGGLALGAIALRHAMAGGDIVDNRLNNAYTNAIPFGDTALLLGFLSVLTRPAGESAALAGVRLLALLGGAYASYLSGTRGGWIAIPPLLLLLGLGQRWHANRRQIVVATVIVLACIGGVATTSVVRARFDAAIQDLHRYDRGDKGDSSVGDRLALWRASTRLFERHPVYGVGRGRLQPALADLARRGEIPPVVVNEHAHSDIFSILAELGAVGIACLGLLYAGMAEPFWRQRRAADPLLRSSAYSGLAVVVATVIFGLTIDNLVPVMVDALTALLAATLLATVDARRRELAASPGASTRV